MKVLHRGLEVSQRVMGRQDREQLETLKHDVAKLQQPLRERALSYIDEQIRHAQQAVAVKRQDLQASWARLQELEDERRQILGEQAMEHRQR